MTATLQQASDETHEPPRPPPLTADDVMTARDVAHLLHAPVSTVEDWARRGILPSVKIGRRRLYIRQNIETTLTRAADEDRSG
jgi:excisionase family DNA binding protein